MLPICTSYVTTARASFSRKSLPDLRRSKVCLHSEGSHYWGSCSWVCLYIGGFASQRSSKAFVLPIANSGDRFVYTEVSKANTTWFNIYTGLLLQLCVNTAAQCPLFLWFNIWQWSTHLSTTCTTIHEKESARRIVKALMGVIGQFRRLSTKGSETWSETQYTHPCYKCQQSITSATRSS